MRMFLFVFYACPDAERTERARVSKHVCFNIADSSLVRSQRTRRRGFYSTRLPFVTTSLPSLFFSVSLSLNRLRYYTLVCTDDINDPRRITSVCPRILDRAVLRKATATYSRDKWPFAKEITDALPSFLPSCPASVVFLYKFLDTASSNLAMLHVLLLYIRTLWE